MPLPRFTPHQTDSESFDLSKAQEAVLEWIDQLGIDVPILQGTLLEDVELSAYIANDIEHKLKRDLRGYFVVRDPASRCHFHVERSTTQSIGDAAWTKVEYDSETYDDGSNFDNATNYQFTAPHKGLYGFTAVVKFDSSTDRNLIRLVGSTAGNISGVWQRGGSGSADDRAVTVGVAALRLVEGETVHIEVYQDSGGDLDVEGGSFFGQSIEWLKDGQDDSDHLSVSNFLRLYSSRDRTVDLWVF